MGAQDFGRYIVLLGFALMCVGLVIWFGSRIPFFGRLPGDVSFQTENVSVYAPLGSMLVVSLILTLLVNFISYLRR